MPQGLPEHCAARKRVGTSYRNGDKDENVYVRTVREGLAAERSYFLVAFGFFVIFVDAARFLNLSTRPAVSMVLAVPV